MDFGRYSNCGYFDNKFDDVGDRLWNGGVPNSVNSMTTFINWVEANRNSTDAADRTSGEFVIDTMEGLYPPTNTRGAAWTLENDWEQRLQLGVAEGTLAVQWFYAQPWNCGQHNTYYQVAENDVAFYITSPATSETPACGPGVTTPAIRFYNPKTGADIYSIKRNCGNPIGGLNALPSVNYTLVPSGWETPDYKVTRGDTGTIHVQLHNNGPSYSQTGTVQVNPVVGGGATGAGNGYVAGGSAVAGQISQPCTPTCVGPGQGALKQGTTTYSTGDGYRTASGIGGQTGPDWYWNYKQLPNGSTVDAAFNFTVPNSAAAGFVTFNICVEPAYQNGATTCAHVTVQIVSERLPSVVGLNGDVNAGGVAGLRCSAGAPAGNVLGNVSNSGSTGQYAVSASGVITDFGSNDTTSSPAGGRLRVGTNGAYECVPREDLMAAADTYRVAGVGYGTIPAGGSVDVSALTAYPVYYFDGANLYIHGVIKNRLTIVAKNGSVHIDGPLTIDTAKYPARLDPATGAGAPSLGIISGRDIDISNATTRVDGYLFAYGAIDTCEQGQGSMTACGGNPLAVNGFLMADHLYMRRTGVPNSFGNTAAEQVALIPQLYLNPPAFFNSAVDQLLIEGQGEKQPLF